MWWSTNLLKHIPTNNTWKMFISEPSKHYCLIQIIFPRQQLLFTNELFGFLGFYSFLHTAQLVRHQFNVMMNVQSTQPLLLTDHVEPRALTN